MNQDYQRPPVRVALVGLGRAMFEDHYPVYKNHPSLFKVVAACDTLKERRDIVEKDFPECAMFRRFEDLLDERNIDLVDIATCSIDHAQHAMLSLSKGFWTLIETPMALTTDEAQLVRGAAVKSRNRLIVLQRGMFSPDYLLARQALTDVRLGLIHDITIRKEDYVRRDDWQSVKRLGGGAAYYAMTDLLIQAMKMLPSQPVQMWSELKRIASLGDAEDFVHVNLRTRTQTSADVEFNGGAIPGIRAPSFVVRGERGTFSVNSGATEGVLRVVDPSFEFPRRRSSVRTPEFGDLHEQFPIVDIPLTLGKDALHGPSAFWSAVYKSVRTGVPFPVPLEDSIQAVKFVHLMKKNSPFAV